MKSLKVDQKNDLVLDASNNLAFVTEQEAVLQNTVTAMRATRGEMPLNMLGGMPYLGTAFDDLDIDAFEAAARRVILAVDKVLSIESFRLQVSGNTLSYQVSVVTTFGIQTIGGSLG